jgi:hypothetical protein
MLVKGSLEWLLLTEGQEPCIHPEIECGTTTELWEKVMWSEAEGTHGIRVPDMRLPKAGSRTGVELGRKNCEICHIILYPSHSLDKTPPKSQ